MSQVGRPRLLAESRTVAVAIEARDHDELLRRSSDAGLSVSQYLREIVTAGLGSDLMLELAMVRQSLHDVQIALQRAQARLESISNKIPKSSPWYGLNDKPQLVARLIEQIEAGQPSHYATQLLRDDPDALTRLRQVKESLEG